MPLTSDPNVQGWFERHGLPWSDVIATSLSHDGIERVEEMKLLPADRFLALFSSEKFIVKQKAKLAFDDLAVEKFNFARCAKNIPLLVGGSPSDISANAQNPNAEQLCPPRQQAWSQAYDVSEVLSHNDQNQGGEGA